MPKIVLRLGEAIKVPARQKMWLKVFMNFPVVMGYHPAFRFRTEFAGPAGKQYNAWARCHRAIRHR